MSLRLVFKPAAHIEFVEATAWYEEQRPGLGKEFISDFDRALHRAQNNPEHFPRVRQQARKIRLRRFSRYSIYFTVKDAGISILAVFHSSRNPAELRPRLG